MISLQKATDKFCGQDSKRVPSTQTLTSTQYVADGIYRYRLLPGEFL